jgi:hypothetical protein
MLPYTGPVAMIPDHAGRPVAPFVRRSSPASLGSSRPAIGQTFDEMLSFSPTVGDIIRLAAHAGAGWLGVYVGLNTKGITSIAGWALGVGNGITGALDIVSLIKRATGTHPPQSTAP